MDTATNYKDIITDSLSKIDDEIGEIISDCESGNYSMKEIADSLLELRNKIY